MTLANYLMTLVALALILSGATAFNPIKTACRNLVHSLPKSSGFRYSMSGTDDDDWYADYNADDFRQYNTNNRDYSGGDRRGGGRRGGHDYERDTSADNSNIDVDAVNALLQERVDARKLGDYDLADSIRDQLMTEYGVRVWDRERVWRSGCSARGSGSRRPSGDRFGDRRSRNRQREFKDFGPLGHDFVQSPDAGPIQASFDETEINELLAERLQCKLSRNFRRADQIQAQLSEGGVYVHDGKKEWRADGTLFGDYRSDDKPGRERGSRSDRRQQYTQSTYSSSEAALTPDQVEEVEALVSRRAGARLSRDYSIADDIREELIADYNVFVDDRSREWSVGGDFGPNQPGSQDRNRSWVKSQYSEPVGAQEEEIVMAALNERTKAKGERDFDTADAIRDSLLDDYNVEVNDRLQEWSVGGDFGITQRKNKDRDRPYVRRGGGGLTEEDVAAISDLVEKRSLAKRNRDFEVADDIRDELQQKYSVKIDDRSREWRVFSDEYVLSPVSGGKVELDDEIVDFIQSRLKERSRYKVERNYDAADAIRDELREKYSVSIDDRVREWSVVVDEFSVMESGSITRGAPSFKVIEDGNEDDVPQAVGLEEARSDDDTVSQVDNVEDENLAELTVVQLKDRLREAGLPVGGKKSELIERLSATT